MDQGQRFRQAFFTERPWCAISMDSMANPQHGLYLPMRKPHEIPLRLRSRRETPAISAPPSRGRAEATRGFRLLPGLKG
jgi:hypothetical protein